MSFRAANDVSPGCEWILTNDLARVAVNAGQFHRMRLYDGWAVRSEVRRLLSCVWEMFVKRRRSRRTMVILFSPNPRPILFSERWKSAGCVRRNSGLDFTREMVSLCEIDVDNSKDCDCEGSSDNVCGRDTVVLSVHVSVAVGVGVGGGVIESDMVSEDDDESELVGGAVKLGL